MNSSVAGETSSAYTWSPSSRSPSGHSASPRCSSFEYVQSASTPCSASSSVHSPPELLRLGAAEPARAEDEPDVALVVACADDRARPAVVRRPDELAVEPDLVRRHRPGLEVVDEKQRVVVPLDGERPRAVAEDLDLAGRARLDPEGRALGTGVAEERPEHEVAHRCPRDADRHGLRLDPNLELLRLDAVAAVELVSHLAVELDVELAAARDADERRLLRLSDRGAGERPAPLHEAVGGDDADVEPSVVRFGAVEDLDAAEEVADVADQDAARLARGTTARRRSRSWP